MVTLLDTLIASDAKSEVASVAPGQVKLESGDGSALHGPPRDLVRRVVSAVDPAAPPVDVAYVASENVTVNVDGDDLGFVIAVDSAEDAARLNNGALSAEQRAALQQGGLLAWKELDGRSTRKLVVSATATETRRALTRPLPVALGPVQPGWKEGIDGIVLSSTARRLGLPLSRSAVCLSGGYRGVRGQGEAGGAGRRIDPHHVGVHRGRTAPRSRPPSGQRSSDSASSCCSPSSPWPGRRRRRCGATWAG